MGSALWPGVSSEGDLSSSWPMSRGGRKAAHLYVIARLDPHAAGSSGSGATSELPNQRSRPSEDPLGRDRPRSSSDGLTCQRYSETQHLVQVEDEHDRDKTVPIRLILHNGDKTIN